jgi:hypothetical protein
MPTPSADTAIKRWLAVAQGKTTDKLLRSSSVIPDGDQIYSFGHHFELARVLRDAKGEIRLILMNGEQVSSHTSTHQWRLRKVVDDEAKLPRVIIPFPALQEAGINLDSITLISDKPDRHETIRHRTHQFPEGARWHQGGTIKTPRAEADIVEQLERWNSYRTGPYGNGEPVITLEEFMTDPRWEYQRYHHTYSRDLRTLRIGLGKYGPEVDVTREDDGTTTYEWTTHRHWLGESLIRARVEWRDEAGKQHHRWAYFLSGFDHQEPTPLYFLAELPYKARPTTVDEAYEVLKPDPIRMADQMGRKYTRQGDIFGIPTGLTRKELQARGARIEKRSADNVWDNTTRRYRQQGNILGTNHRGTEVAYLPGGLTLARGCLYHDPIGRERDHIRRKLGDGQAWHIVVKNTVPTAGRR